MVKCAKDPKSGDPVLTITAHGDLYTGTGPNGIFRNGSARGPDDEFSGWAWISYQPKCSPYCNVRRVGGSLSTLQEFGEWQGVGGGGAPSASARVCVVCFATAKHPSFMFHATCRVVCTKQRALAPTSPCK